MSFTTVSWFLFLAAGLLIYYLLPGKCRRFQWVVLLGMSLFYLSTFSWKGILLLFMTIFGTYAGGRVLDYLNKTEKETVAANKAAWPREQRKAYRASMKKKKRAVLIVLMLYVFGILAVIKYTGFVLENVNAIRAALGQSTFSIPTMLLPLGISFYTFQSASYLIDLYNGKIEAQKNIGKLALFVCFFPQLMQGPIGRFDRLEPQLIQERRFDFDNFEYGLIRIGWGLFKKMVLADRAGSVTATVFSAGVGNYHGFQIAVGILMYSIQLYADFSGGIDIVIGAAQMFGITMDENFRQPYFSTSISDFWRRWHITLGTWMKDYIFYPFSLSKSMSKLGHWAGKKLGRFGRGLPIALGDLLVFFVVGIWHGASWKYIIYGIYNGGIMAFSSFMAPLYRSGFEKFHINPKSRGWHIFQIIRTFILVQISWYFDIPNNLSEGNLALKLTFTSPSFAQFTNGDIAALGLLKSDYLILLFGCLVIFFVSLYKERTGKQVRETLAAKPLALRWTLYLLMLLSILLLGWAKQTSGFIYANF